MYQIFKDFAGPVATIIASITAAGVAWAFALRQIQIAKQQAETSLDQLRYSIFEKRYAIYTSARGLIESTLDESPLTAELGSRSAHRALRLSEARFFFSDETCRWLDGLQQECRTYGDAKRLGAVTEEHYNRLSMRLKRLPERFEKELKFRQLTEQK